ncbi:hypothetical protein A2U01_0070717, partial [Trifolium medium]|nr:hypothetical protein [Trifolium medium]
MTTLRCSHLLLNHPDLLGCLLNNLGSKHDIISRFKPTQRRPALPTIQRLKRCHSYTRVKTIVV